MQTLIAHNKIKLTTKPAKTFNLSSDRTREGPTAIPVRHREFRHEQTKAHGDMREEPSAHEGSHRPGEDRLGFLVRLKSPSDGAGPTLSSYRLPTKY